MDKPVKQISAVLYALINREYVTERDFKYNGFRSRISELRWDYGIPIKSELIPFVNEFGAKCWCLRHKIEKGSKKMARAVYKQINVR